MRLAFLYAGQGSQHVGMGADIYEAAPEVRHYFDRAVDGVDLRTLCFDGPEELLFQTRFNQVAMSAFALAVTDLLKGRGLQPVVTAGLSLGEYNALYAAEATSGEDVLNLLAVRGKAMQDACDNTPGAMAAVMGLPVEEIESICASVSRETDQLVQVANYNSSGQYVVAGRPFALAKASEALQETGARRVIPLAVAGAFHTPLMAEAVPPLEKVLEGIAWQEPTCPVISNVTAEPIPFETINEELTRQVVHPVRFEETMSHLTAYQLDGIIEIGPGKALAGFLKRSPLKEIPVIAIRQMADIAGAVSLFGGDHE